MSGVYHCHGAPHDGQYSGMCPRNTILALVLRLGLNAGNYWIKLEGFKRLGQVIRGVKFSDGTPVVTDEQHVEDGLISRSAA